MKKVLIVSYYWPPAGGPGVQRILKFTKYLPDFGWEPVILTVKESEFPARDDSLSDDIPQNISIYKTRSLEPGMLYKKFIGLKKNEQIPTSVLAEKNKNWKKKLAMLIRLNIFVPDAKRGWVHFAVNKGMEIIKKEKPDLIFSSSPPPSTHLIAEKLATKSGLKWVADFRDPWVDIHYYESLPRLKVIKEYDQKLELKVLNKADRIVCISKLDIEHDFGTKVPSEKCINIPNGYDEDDFQRLPEVKKLFKGFILMHLGAIGKERIPFNLLKAIKKLDVERTITPEKFRFICIGKSEEGLKQAVSDSDVSDYFQHIEYLPHKEAIAHSMHASVMLLLITQSKKNNRILPGKTFEYIRTRKPILALGPEKGEVSRIIKDGRFGKTINYDNFHSIYDSLKELILKSEHPNEGTSPAIQKYERKFLTKQLNDIFNHVVD